MDYSVEDTLAIGPSSHRVLGHPKCFSHGWR